MHLYFMLNPWLSLITLKPDNLLKKLSPKDAAMLQQALSDKETTARILATPQAQEIIRKLMERK